MIRVVGAEHDDVVEALHASRETLVRVPDRVEERFRGFGEATSPGAGDDGASGGSEAILPSQPFDPDGVRGADDRAPRIRAVR